MSIRAEIYKYDKPSLHHGVRYEGILFVDKEVEVKEYAHTLWGIKRLMKKARKKYLDRSSDTQTLVEIINNI